MGLTGDFGALDRLRSRLSGLAGARRSLLQALAEEAETLVDQGFHRGIDPNDRPWAPLKYREGQPLRDTGRLMNSYVSRVTEDGVAIGTNVEYAPPHQFGAHIKPHQRTGGHYQPVNRRGRFIKKRTAMPSSTEPDGVKPWEKRKRVRTSGPSTRIRYVRGGNYANGITIPARPMLPSGEPGERWKRGFRRVIASWMREQLEGSG